MGKFRISFGSADCKNLERRPPLERAVCERLLAKIENLKQLSYSQLDRFSEYETEDADVEGKKVLFTIFKEKSEDESLVLVVQAFLPTLRFPTYFSLHGVGKIFAEGIVVRASGQKEDVPADKLYGYK